MKKANKPKQEHQKGREQRPSVQPAGMVELTEQDLERVQGGQSSLNFTKIEINS